MIPNNIHAISPSLVIYIYIYIYVGMNWIDHTGYSNQTVLTQKNKYTDVRNKVLYISLEITWLKSDQII